MRRDILHQIMSILLLKKRLLILPFLALAMISDVYRFLHAGCVMEDEIFKYGHNCSLPCECVTNHTSSCHAIFGTCTCKPDFALANCTVNLRTGKHLHRPNNHWYGASFSLDCWLAVCGWAPLMSFISLSALLLIHFIKWACVRGWWSPTNVTMETSLRNIAPQKNNGAVFLSAPTEYHYFAFTFCLMYTFFESGHCTFTFKFFSDLGCGGIGGVSWVFSTVMWVCGWHGVMLGDSEGLDLFLFFY